MFYINITTGKADNNNIVIKHPSISDNHGEISMFEDGRIVYEDFSTNGTIVGGKKIRGTSMDIRQNETILLPGENILPWAKIPNIPSEIKEAKAVYNIGREDNNLVRLSNTRTGRRHATIFVDKDGDFKIIDLSLHGTTVNGSKLPPYKAKSVKYGDKVVFANSEELDWKNIPRPAIKKKSILWIIGGITVIIPVLWMIYNIIANRNCTFDNFQGKHEKQTVFVLKQCYGRVKIGGEVVGYFGSEADPRVKNWSPTIEGLKPISFHGTGFGVIGDGRFATNYHVAQNLNDKDFIDVLNELGKRNPFFSQIIKELNDQVNSGKKVEIDGGTPRVFIIHDGVIINVEERYDPHLERFSERFLEVNVVNPDKGKDLAILQLKDKSKSKWFEYYQFDDFSTQQPKKDEEIRYLGYPWETVQVDKEQNSPITAGIFGGNINGFRSNGDFQIDASVQGGASGSAVLNRCGKVVGYVTYGWGEGETTNFCKPSKNLIDLLRPYKNN